MHRAAELCTILLAELIIMFQAEFVIANPRKSVPNIAYLPFTVFHNREIWCILELIQPNGSRNAFLLTTAHR